MQQSPEPLEVDIVRRSTREILRGLGMIGSQSDANGLTLTQLHILSEIDKDAEITGARLSFLLNLDRSTISRTLRGMIGMGLVTKIEDPADRRLQRLGITPAAKTLLEDARGYSKRQIHEILFHLSPDERKAVICGLELYAGAIRKEQHLEAFTFRMIEPRDNPKMAKICRDTMLTFGVSGCNSSASDPEMDNLSEAYSAPNSEYWVILHGRKLVGGGGFMQLKGGDRTVCELQKMYFTEEVRGMGLGNRLLRLLLERMQACGYKACYLETVEAMTSAQRLYEAFGFERLKQPMGNTGHSVCNVWYAKMIRD